jgi:membrane protein required for colicin V production
MMTVEPYDVVMLAVLLLATVRGAWKGVAWQLASLAAIVVSYVVAYRYRVSAATWMPVGAPWGIFLAMLVLYLGTSLGIWMVFRWISRLIDRLKLKSFDRQVGAVLGFSKGVILCVIITLFAVTLLGERQRQAIVDSRSGFCIAVLLSKSRTAIPDEFREVLKPYVEVFEGRLQRSRKDGPRQGSGGV